MTRAAYAGLQRYTFGWTGDSGNCDDVTQGWAQMANQIPVLLSAGLGLIPLLQLIYQDIVEILKIIQQWLNFIHVGVQMGLLIR